MKPARRSRPRILYACICCTVALMNLTQAYGQQECPLPTSSAPLCAQLQGQMCITTAPGTECKPLVVRYDPLAPNQLVALDCTCAGPGDCGPVDVVGNIVRCAGICPVPPAGNECEIYINGQPSGQSAVVFTDYAPGTLFTCGCNPNPPACLPRTDGQGCQQTQCPNPNETCRPRCVRIGADGTPRVIDCDCRQSFECHVELLPGGTPACQGECPPGQHCVTTVTTDADGSTTICCDCQPDDIECGPEPDGSACRPVTCPNPDETCKPKCVLVGLDGTMAVDQCDCGPANACHAEIGPAGPICVGDCPQGMICFQRVYTTTAGTLYCCECVDDPPFCEPNASQDGCKPFACPVAGEFCQPRCARFNPATGQFQVVDCDCRGEQECHVEFIAGAGPQCQGKCPPGQYCVENVVQNADGSFEICCDCLTPECDCPGDMNGDGVINGADIQGFVNCYLSMPTPGDNCTCADINGDGIVDLLDVSLFVQRILNKESCDPVPCCPAEDLDVDLTTGVDDNGNVIAFGMNDDQWTVTCEPGSGGVLPRPAIVIPAHPAWQTIPGSRWISANQTGPNGTYCYEYCFCLDERFKTPTLTLVTRADDAGQIYLNGNFLGNVGPFNGPAVTITTSNPAFFQPGENCIRVVIQNLGGVVTGFDFAGSLFVRDGKCCCDPMDLDKTVATGVDDNTNGLIPVGSNDDTWTVTVDASGGSVPRPATVINPHPAWLTIPGTQWVSANATGPNGLYVFQYCFCLDPRFKNPVLDFYLRADDAATVWLNGVQIGATPNGWAFNTPQPTHVVATNPALFRPCENCVEIRVINGGGVVTGFNLLGSIRAKDGLCCDDRVFSCCMPDGSCIPLLPPATKCPQGGVKQFGPCRGDAACCLPDGTCDILDRRCCENAGGTPLPAGTTCANQTQACCIQTAAGTTCRDTDPVCCEILYGGTPQGPGSVCLGDNNNNHIDDACEPPPPLSCCLGNGLCVDLAPGTFTCPDGSAPFSGPCQNNLPCCLPNGVCQPLEPHCCERAGGTPLPAGTTCAGTTQACCIQTTTGATICRDVDPACCQFLYGGTPQGPGSHCLGDNNHNGYDDACEPANPLVCCTPDGGCVVLPPPLFVCPDGTPPFPGPCLPAVGCCLPDGTCQFMEPHCCEKSGGSPLPAGISCSTGAPQACCIQTPVGTICRDAEPVCCQVFWGGTPQGPGTACQGDANQNGIDDACEPPTPKICCKPDGTCNPVPAGTTVCPDGTPPLAGPCNNNTGCCLPDGVCRMTDPRCCQAAGGVPLPTGLPCSTALQACCIQTPNGTICRDLDPYCCESIYGGIPQGAGTVCLGDANQNGIDDACEPPQPFSCCLPDGTCINVPAGTACPDGSPAFPGPCQPPVACCLPSGGCQTMEPHCCQNAGGTALPAGVTCTGTTEACCIVNAAGGTICRDADPICCQAVYGGVPQGPGTHCQGDLNQNGIDDACEPQSSCGPDPTAPRCRPTQCPVSGQECLPRCVIVEPGTQFVISVADCECKSPNECHIEVTPAPSTYTCVGSCPPGMTCVTTTITPDGLEMVCCECVPDTGTVCPLNTAGSQLCANLQFSHCTTPTPDPSQFCAPTLIITNGPGGGIFAEQCSCVSDTTCGGVSVIPDGNGNYFLRCVGPCTGVQSCRLIINGNPVTAGQVNTGNLPPGTTVKCGCAQ